MEANTLATKFSAELDERMRIPDETADQYTARMADRSNRLLGREASSPSDGLPHGGSGTNTPRSTASNYAGRHSTRVERDETESAVPTVAGEQPKDHKVYTPTLEHMRSGKRRSSDHPSGESGPPEKRRRQEGSPGTTAPYRQASSSAARSAQPSGASGYHTVVKGLNAGKPDISENRTGKWNADKSPRFVDGDPARDDFSTPSQQPELFSRSSGCGSRTSTASRASGLSREDAPQPPCAAHGRARAYTQSVSDIQAATGGEPSALPTSLIRTELPAGGDQETTASSPPATSTEPTCAKGQPGSSHGHARPSGEISGNGAVAASADTGDTTCTTPASTETTAATQPAATSARTKSSSRKAKGNHDKDQLSEPQTLPDEVQKRMTPAEFAAYIGPITPLSAQGRKKPFFKGMRIYYVGCDGETVSSRTRIKMKRMVEFGATLVPTYDPAQIDVIMTQPPLTEEVFCAKHGFKSANDVPAHIPIVKTTWMTSGETNSKIEPWEMHASYKSHIVTQPKSVETKKKTRTIPPKPLKSAKRTVAAKPKPKVEVKVEKQPAVNSDESDFEAEERYSRQPALGRLTDGKASSAPGPSRGPGQADAAHDGDPLAQFYDAARAEQQEEREGYFEFEKRPEGEQCSPFTCDTPRRFMPRWGQSPNQDIIDIFKQLLEIYEIRKSPDDQHRVRVYKEVIPNLEKYPKRIETREELADIKRVGERTKDKIMEIIKTGRLSRLQFEMTAEIGVMKLFQGIYDVGPITALKWYAVGCRTLEDIRQRKGGIKLTDTQKLGLQHYKDINSRIPRQEVEEIFKLIQDIARGIDPKLVLQVTGSYRRGKADCGDIDILITRPTDGKRSHSKQVMRLVNLCQGQGIIVDHLIIPDNFWGKELVYRGLCRKDENSPVRRIDFLSVEWKSRGAALLYFTGDDIFNRSMRQKAKSMGYSLNQRGLHDMVVRNPKKSSEKLTEGIVIASETEEEIFEKLGVPWQEPHQRARG